MTLVEVTGRDVAALQDPRPVCLIGACGADGETCFATVIWVTPVSHKPPMLAFALRAKSHTMGLLRASGAFSCATLPATEKAVELSEFCGGNTGRLVNKGSQVPHALVEVALPAHDAAGAALADRARNDGNALDRKLEGGGGHDAAFPAATLPNPKRTAFVPVPDAALSWTACTVDSIQEAGDHLLVIGTVAEARIAADTPRDAHGRLLVNDTLLCVQHGAYTKAAAR